MHVANPQHVQAKTNIIMWMIASFCLLTDHEVGYGGVNTQGKDPHGDEVNEHLGQEEDRHTIVATHILMAERSKDIKSIIL